MIAWIVIIGVSLWLLVITVVGVKFLIYEVIAANKRKNSEEDRTLEILSDIDL